MSIARCRTVVGSLYALMRNALGLNVTTSLESQEMSCTVAPDRRLVVLGHEPIAGFARDHGTVANDAAMLALHTLDSATLLAEPTFVAPGDSCLRADDPGWRWHCIAGHGTTLADWERRPLAGALDGKQAASANLTSLAGVASTAAGRNLLTLAQPESAKIPRINADSSISLIDVPSGAGGARGLFSGLLSAAAPSVANTGLSGWYNQQGSTVTDLAHALMVSAPAANTSSISGITGTVASGATLTALCALGRRQTTGYPSLAFGFTDGTRYHGFLPYWDPEVCRYGIGIVRWSDSATQASSAGITDYIDYPGCIWLRYRRAGGMVYWEISANGASWCPIYTEPEAGLYLDAYTTALFGARPSGSIALDVVLHSLVVG